MKKVDSGGEKSVRDRILSAAEAAFAEACYSEVSIRQIAASSKVNLALVSYHFGSKEGLYRAVVKRRGDDIVRARERALAEFESRQTPPTLEELVRAYIKPVFDIKREGPRGIAFVKVQARLHNEADELFLRIRREIYDEISKRYIRILEKTMPQVRPQDISWRIAFLIGAVNYMLPGVDRLNDLSDNTVSATDIDQLEEQLARFLVAGLSAPSAGGEGKATK